MSTDAEYKAKYYKYLKKMEREGINTSKLRENNSKNDEMMQKLSITPEVAQEAEVVDENVVITEKEKSKDAGSEKVVPEKNVEQDVSKEKKEDVLETTNVQEDEEVFSDTSED